MHLTSFEKAVIHTYIYRYFSHLLFHLSKLKSNINPKFQNYFWSVIIHSLIQINNPFLCPSVPGTVPYQMPGSTPGCAWDQSRNSWSEFREMKRTISHLCFCSCFHWGRSLGSSSMVDAQALTQESESSRQWKKAGQGLQRGKLPGHSRL